MLLASAELYFPPALAKRISLALPFTAYLAGEDQNIAVFQLVRAVY